MTAGSTPGGVSDDAAPVGVLQAAILGWYAENARDLPWRAPVATPWGVFVSEIMAQQTPVARVVDPWRAWLARWPEPSALAADPPGEAVRAWDRLGYPRRALRLHQSARVMVERHAGRVPGTEAELLELPGVGAYTAAAVAAFAFGRRTTVVDTNVRRVQARLVTGLALPAPALTRAEAALAARLVPEDPPTSAVWNVAVMELGALVCTARGPACESCPVRGWCAWQRAGALAYAGPPRKAQGYAGTDREIRGRLLAVVRAAPHPVDLTALYAGTPLGSSAAGAERARLERCLESLIDDGLLQRQDDRRIALPGMGPTGSQAQ